MQKNNKKAVTVAIINQKGGVGKTTTAAALAAGLSLNGYKVLSIDMDAQCNLSYSAGAAPDAGTILGVITKEISAADAIQHTKNGDIIPSSKFLAGADAFLNKTGKEYILKEALEGISADYDFIVIDTPPALGIITVNALVASDSVVIPAQADIYSLQGIEQLAETIGPIKKYFNPELKIAGIILTRFNPRTILSQDAAELAEQLAARIGTKVFRTTIREGITIKEAQITQENIFLYAPRAKVTEDYKKFIEEFTKEV